MKVFQKIMMALCFVIPVFSNYAGGSGETQTEKERGSLIVFNAASTSEIILGAAELFEKQTGIIVKTNPAASGTLARQLEAGAEADIYISASKKWVDYTQELGLVSEQSEFAGNQLVLIVPLGSGISLFEIRQGSKFPDLFEGFFSMGDPAFVPAGKYAKESLSYYHWYTELEKRILPAPDVRSALAVVEAAEADFGIVYETDAAASNEIKIAARFPEESHSPIRYYCALLNDSSKEAAEFYHFLFSEEARELFLSRGFSLPVTEE